MTPVGVTYDTGSIVTYVPVRTRALPFHVGLAGKDEDFYLFRLRTGIELQERKGGKDEDQEFIHRWFGGGYFVDHGSPGRKWQGKY